MTESSNSKHAHPENALENLRQYGIKKEDKIQMRYETLQFQHDINQLSIQQENLFL